MKKIILTLSIAAGMVVGFVTSFAQTGIISTAVGNGTWGYTGDGGPATSAQITSPYGVATDTAGDYYIAEEGRIRKVSATGVITTFAGVWPAGSSGDGGPALSAAIGGSSEVNCITTDEAGNVYFGEHDRVRKINTAGIISTVAGDGTSGTTVDGSVATTTPVAVYGIAVDPSGNIYITDGFATVRKVNTSGIINIIAGTGTAGFSGDGGPATAAQLNNASSIALDNSGNLYIADSGNGRIRMINTSGIISTVAGNGVGGSTGDCGPATSAALDGPGGVCVDASNNIYILERGRIRKVNAGSGIISTFAGNGTSGYSGDGGPAISAGLEWSFNASGIAVSHNYLYIIDYNNRVRQVALSSAGTTDSFTVSINKLCTGEVFSFITSTYSPSHSVKTYYGDGLSDITPISSSGFCYGMGTATHLYAASGTYTVKHVLMNGTLAIDSISYSSEYLLCSVLPIKNYIDLLGTCSYGTTDPYIRTPALFEIDSNGLAVDTVSVTSGTYYTAYGVAGDLYTFRVLAPPSGLPTICPITGILLDTLQPGTIGATKYFGFSCNPASTSFDLSEHDIIPVSDIHRQTGTIYVSNFDCFPEWSTVTLHYSPKYNGATFTYPPAVSAASNTITWNLGALDGTNPSPLALNYTVYYSTIALSIGDTVQSHVSITPLTGDSDPSNNSEMIIDTVSAAVDPNEMWVSPEGYISGGTQLHYTINFENTGNDTAYNIYVMDTLSDNVDASSLRITSCSNVMNIGQLHNGVHNVIKFDFPNINLLDSSHHGMCDGYVSFAINAKSGLLNGATIFNEAGIYFDNNPVVMTNTVEDIIEVPTGVTDIPSTPKESLFPNPATDELTIKTDNSTYSSFTITNTIGQEMMCRNISSTQTNVNVKSLPAGVYYVTLKGDDGRPDSHREVMKFVKW